jgi:tripartite-type tricarboxylate transporter receptor subunit TctC
VKKLFKVTAAAAVAAATLVAVNAVQAQAYPDKPVTLVVGFAPGGPTDIVARTLAVALEKQLGQNVLVENKAGAGAIIGIRDVVKANADGYRLLVHHIGMSTAPSLYRKLPFDPLTDFEYVGVINDVPMILLTKADLPVNNLKDLTTYLQANKSKVSLANAGLGSASHLCGLMLMSALKTDLTTVPYKGTAPAMTDLIGGQVDMLCDQTTSVSAQLAGNKIKPIVITTAKRMPQPALKGIPSAVESGLPGFQVSVWHGLYAPKGTPKSVVYRLASALQSALADPVLRAKFDELGANTASKEQATPDALAALLKSEIGKWGPIIKANGQYAD